ncbi:MAG: c-type cytochrome [Fulvivirga sp.]|nr:c-type cytochrome [Fulvivirga sp.]
MKHGTDKILALLRAAYALFIALVIFGVAFLVIYANPSLLQFDFKPDTVTWQPKTIDKDLPQGEKGELIKYGYELIVNTPHYIGPLANEQAMRFAGNNLTCGNCHLKAGRKIASGSFVGIADRFPQFRGRENKMGTLAERIHGCMERSMNGKRMPENSREMQAMIAYMEFLSEDVPKDMLDLYKGYQKIDLPYQMADTITGKFIYESRCLPCHGKNGRGTPKPGDTFNGYLYPPLGGDDTFNDGAGMNRVITAAEFIKYNMPFGASYDAPILSDEEAYHVAAYINTFERPEKSDKSLDFPDKKLKPASTPYGPWADNFPPEQHKFGPFQPIFDYYEKKYGIKKTK